VPPNVAKEAAIIAKSVKASSYSNAPVFTAILGFFVFKEVLQVNELIGSAIILGSAIVLHQVEINKQ
jgi:drug/metabolite transporter (DMT)-like permease